MKKISIFKNDKKASENAPDYRIVASYQDATGAWVNETVGSLWRGKQDNPKAPALTGNLTDAREYNGTQYPGYKLVPDGVNVAMPAQSKSVLPEYPPTEDINPEDIPF